MQYIRPNLGRIKRIDEEELYRLKKLSDILTGVIVFFIAILIARLWFLQIHNGDKYARLAENNRVRVLDIVAPRGNILDRYGKLIVATRPSFNVVWTKEDSPDQDLILKRMSKILGEDATVLLQRIRSAVDNPRHIPVRLKEDIDWKTLAYLENNHFELPGISVVAAPTRDYLFGDLASHLLGYLGEVNQEELKEKRWENYQSGEQLGKTGIEKYYEESLRGEKGTEYLEVNAYGFEQRRLQGLEPLSGNDLSLTIDRDLQEAAEQAMSGRAGAVVVMEVNTGRLLVLASCPPLPLEKFIGGISAKNWKDLNESLLYPLMNKPIVGQYPPGSTYKIVTALAGLQENVINPNTVFYCSGSLAFGNRVYGCWKKGGHGAISLHRAIAESCDVYFYQVGQKVGVDRLAKYANEFGLGMKTGIELDYEKAGLIPTSEWKRRVKKEEWQKGETLNIAIGQGFDQVTPLQLCRLTATLANGGVRYRPQLIEKINDPDGKLLAAFSPVEEGRIAGKTYYLELIRQGMVAAVNDAHGTGKAASLRGVGITVAGKTGTAQVVKLAQSKNMPVAAIPYKYRDHAWFTCFAPAEKPEIAVTVLIEHGGHGGSAAAPVAKAVLEVYFKINVEAVQQAGPDVSNPAAEQAVGD